MLSQCSNSLWMRDLRRNWLRVSLMDFWFKTDACWNSLRFLTRLKMPMESWVMSNLLWLKRSSLRNLIRLLNLRLLFSLIANPRLIWIESESEVDQVRLVRLLLSTLLNWVSFMTSFWIRLRANFSKVMLFILIQITRESKRYTKRLCKDLMS